MAARQRAWATKARAALIALLGGKCAWCETTEDLTFDCIIPCDWGHHKRMDQSWRMSFYRHQHQEHGNVQVLCRSCNSIKGDSVSFHRHEIEPVPADAPF